MIATIPVVDAFLDESSDQERKDVFAVGSFLTAENNWKMLQSEWVKRLTKHGIEYFHTASCKKVSGPFLNLRRKYPSLDAAKKAAANIRADMEDILLSSDRWGGFGLGIVAPDYDFVLREIPEARLFYATDYTVAAYQQMMYVITRAVRRENSKHNVNHRVAFLVDQSSASEKIGQAYKAIKVHHPVIGKSMASCGPLDDKITPPLQMADLLASITKDAFLAWLKLGKPSGFPLDTKWVPHFVEPFGLWDTGHMLHSLGKTVTSSRFAKGMLVPQQWPKITKRDRKRMRKALLKRTGAT